MKEGKPLIMVVEDDRPVMSLLTNTLKMNNYQYISAVNGNTALMEAASRDPDIILMDLGLPDVDGIEIIEKIRSWSNSPIIVISARDEDKDKIKALDAGADDYLTKPFSVDELLARLRAVIRRVEFLEDRDETREAVFKNGSMVIDYAAATVTIDGKLIHLMPIEYSLLCLLAQNVGKVLTHSDILKKVWHNSYESDLSSLRVYMASLRKKIESGCERGTYIQTHVGIGYRMLRIDD